MSCEYRQTCCEDKNMEADRNKRWLGERREAEREREMQRATGVLKCWRDCAGMVARGLSVEWVPLPLLSPSEMLYAGAQMLESVCDTHMHAQSDGMVVQVLNSLLTMFISGCQYATTCMVLEYSTLVFCHCLSSYSKSVHIVQQKKHLSEISCSANRKAMCHMWQTWCVCWEMKIWTPYWH